MVKSEIIIKTVAKLYSSLTVVVIIISIFIGYNLSSDTYRQANDAYDRAHAAYDDFESYKNRTSQAERKKYLELIREGERINIFDGFDKNGKRHFPASKRELVLTRKIALEQELEHNKQDLYFRYNGTLSDLSSDLDHFKIEYFKRPSLFVACFSFICVIVGTYLAMFLFGKWVRWLFRH